MEITRRMLESPDSPLSSSPWTNSVIPESVWYFLHGCCHDARHHLWTGRASQCSLCPALALEHALLHPAANGLMWNADHAPLLKCSAAAFLFISLTVRAKIWPATSLSSPAHSCCFIHAYQMSVRRHDTFACRGPSGMPMAHSLTLSGLCSSVFSERPSYWKSLSFYLKLRHLYYLPSLARFIFLHSTYYYLT